MKKALVLGVLAFFAINIANVNAQDRTNVQEKGKKTYNQEPASKKENKAINEGKKIAPAPTKSKQLPKNTQKGVSSVNKTNTEKTLGAEIVKDEPKLDPKAEKTQVEQDNAKTATPSKKTSANDTKNVKKESKNDTKNINNSVPPTKKVSKKTGTAASSTTTR